MISPTPRVSVLMPVRDAARTLPTALRSLARQTFRDVEIVAVDDGSQDGSGGLLEGWRGRDPRLRVLRRPAEGLVAALQAGLDACRAPLIARMDADDAMLPRRLERQVDLLHRRLDIDVAGCRVRCVPRPHIAEGFRIYEGWLNSLIEPGDHFRERFIESPLAHPTVMARVEVMRSAGGYRDRGWPEDYDLWLRLLERGHRFAKVDEVLHFWRDHPGRQTRVHGRYRKPRFLAVKAHFLARGPLGEAARVLIWGAGPTGKALAKALRAEGRGPEAFLDIDAKKVGRRPAGVPVYPHTDLPKLWRPGSRLLVAVARRGARDLIRPHLWRHGLVEGEDVWFAA